MTDSAYWTGAHTKHKLRYHLVWVPKYRKRVLIGKLAQRLEELFYQAAEVNVTPRYTMTLLPSFWIDVPAVNLVGTSDGKNHYEAILSNAGDSSFFRLEIDR